MLRRQRKTAPVSDANEVAELREKVRRQAADIRQMQLVLERKNRLLDALHVVWCDGGCASGVHRFQGADVLVTEELVQAAERNTGRLRGWYESVKFRFETYGPDPADSSRRSPATASEWHRQYAERAAARTDLSTAGVKALAVNLLKEAFFLRQNGERPPGSEDATWHDWDGKADRFLRSLLPPGPEAGG